MKTFLKLSGLAAFILLFIHFGCQKDESIDGPPPTGENVPNEIITAPGSQIAFSGTFSDENGFSSISLVNEELLLDKQIVFANLVKKYYLDYKFTIPASAASDIYNVEITATNLGGQTQSFTSKVDVATNPESSDMVSSINATPGDEIAFTGTITDGQGISAISISSGSLGIDELIEPDGNPLEYLLNYKFSVPLDAEKKVHKVIITVGNIKNREVAFNVSVNLSGEAVVYENIYIAGSFQWWTWNPEVAYPMTADPENNGWFETQVHTWDTYDELKFLAQLAWEPDNWGLVDQNDPSKGMLNDNNSDPVRLPANGANPAYYNLRFNPYQMKYEATLLTDVIQGIPELYIVGKGFPDYPDLDWNPSAAIKMEKNPWDFGEHIFIIEGLKFSNAVDLKFIGQNTGWSPYDAGFEVGGEMTAPVSWAKVKEGDGTADLKFKDQAGTYTVLFDYYLKRACVWKEE
jgi:hypothetical protein